jgi:sterol desaturase/sphingolipid hydroxylase (fatty acid hydroxylase superfamily)
VERADELDTKAAAVRAYVAAGSPRVIMVSLLVVLVARLLVGNWSSADLFVLGVTVVLVGPVEWFIHLFLLHADEDAWTSRRLGTGAGHREHHLDPPEIHWLLLRPADAATFVVLLAVWTALWTVPLVLVADAVGLAESAPLAPWLTGWLLALVSLAHYEWTHLLVHTRYRPRTTYFRRLARNHRLHHFRNENYWLGVTSNLGDRIMRTYPADKSDVPVSDTARTLV